MNFDTCWRRKVTKRGPDVNLLLINYTIFLGKWANDKYLCMFAFCLLGIHGNNMDKGFHIVLDNLTFQLSKHT